MLTVLLVFVLCVCAVAWLEIRSKKHNEDKNKWVKSMMEDLRSFRDEPAYRCKYCGAQSEVHPQDQRPPPDYCHESDHTIDETYE